MSFRRLLFLILVLGTMGFVVYRVVLRAELLKQKKAEKSKAKSAKTIPVEVAGVGVKSVEDLLLLTGDIKGLNVASVLPKVPGKLMKKVKEVGDSVKKGDVIALVDRDEPALKFAAAEVSSPLEGILTRYFLDLGQNVTPATPVCEIAEIASVKVVVNITEKDLPRIKIGLKARFTNDAYPGKIYEGRVSKISESLDLLSRSSEVEIVSENPGSLLKPGMFARVSIILDTHADALVIPKRAVEYSGESHYVYVVQDNKAHHKAVTIGLTLAEEVEILQGLEKGEQVISVGWHNVNEGSSVEVVSG